MTDPNFAQRSQHVSRTARLIRDRLLVIDGPISHRAFVELREAQEELDKVVKRCRKHLGITGVGHATTVTPTRKQAQPTNGDVS